MLIHTFFLITTSLTLQQVNTHLIEDAFDVNPIRKLFQRINDRQRDSRSILEQQLSSQYLNSPENPSQSKALWTESPKSLYKLYKPPVSQTVPRLVKIRIKFGRNTPESLQPAEHRDHKLKEPNKYRVVGEKQGRGMVSEEVLDENVGEREREFGKKSLEGVERREVLEEFESREEVNGPEGSEIGEAVEGEIGFGEILRNLEIVGTKAGLSEILIKRRRLDGGRNVEENELDGKNSERKIDETDSVNPDKIEPENDEVKESFAQEDKENFQASETISPAAPKLNHHNFQTNENFRKNLLSNPTNRKILIYRKPLRRTMNTNPNSTNEYLQSISSNGNKLEEMMQLGVVDLTKQRPFREKLVAHKSPLQFHPKIDKLKTEEEFGIKEGNVNEDAERKASGVLEQSGAKLEIDGKGTEGLDQNIQIQNYNEVQNPKEERFQNEKQEIVRYEDVKTVKTQENTPQFIEAKTLRFNENKNIFQSLLGLDQTTNNLDDTTTNYEEISTTFSEFSGDFGAPNVRQLTQDELKELTLEQNVSKYSLYRRRLKGNVN